jgi:hypothetical protein
VPWRLHFGAVRPVRPQGGGHGDEGVKSLVHGGANLMGDPGWRYDDIARGNCYVAIANDHAP